MALDLLALFVQIQPDDFFLAKVAGTVEHRE